MLQPQGFFREHYCLDLDDAPAQQMFRISTLTSGLSEIEAIANAMENWLSEYKRDLLVTTPRRQRH